MILIAGGHDEKQQLFSFFIKIIIKIHYHLTQLQHLLHFASCVKRVKCSLYAGRPLGSLHLFNRPIKETLTVAWLQVPDTLLSIFVQLYTCKNVNPIKNLNGIDSFLIKLCNFFSAQHFLPVALSPTLFCWESEVWVGVASPSLSDGLPESLEDTLTESMLSPELPVGGERGVSLTGELAELLSVPRKSLNRKWSELLNDKTLKSPCSFISSFYFGLHFKFKNSTRLY